MGQTDDIESENSGDNARGRKIRELPKRVWGKIENNVCLLNRGLVASKEGAVICGFGCVFV